MVAQDQRENNQKTITQKWEGNQLYSYSKRQTGEIVHKKQKTKNVYS